MSDEQWASTNAPEPIVVCGGLLGTFTSWDEYGDEVVGFQGAALHHEAEKAIGEAHAVEEGDNLVVDFREGTLECMDAEGMTRWKRDLVEVLAALPRANAGASEGAPQCL